MDDEETSIKPDLEGDTEMAMLDDFESTEVGFVTPAGELEGLEAGAAEAATLDGLHDAITEPVAAATRAAVIAAVDAAAALPPPPADPRTPIVPTRRAGTLPRAIVERRAVVDAAAEALASADSAIERLAGADSSIEFRAVSDTFEAVDPPPPRAHTAEFWPPPGPVPAGTHGPKRQARMFPAVEDETREWLDSDQVTVVPSPDDF